MLKIPLPFLKGTSRHPIKTWQKKADHSERSHILFKSLNYTAVWHEVHVNTDLLAGRQLTEWLHTTRPAAMNTTCNHDRHFCHSQRPRTFFGLFHYLRILLRELLFCEYVPGALFLFSAGYDWRGGKIELGFCFCILYSVFYVSKGCCTKICLVYC